MGNKKAGIEAHGVNPNAVKAMNEAGIDISNHTLDIIDPKDLNNADLVVTLCGDAADKCPVTHPTVKRERWGFDDPEKAEGTDEEKWAFFGAFVMKLVKESSVLLKLVSN